MGKQAAALTDRQRRFVDEYLVDLNGTQAAIRAGYSKRSATELAYKNLRKPAVAAAIDRALGRYAGASRSRIVEELAAIAFADAGDYFAWGPEGVALKDSATLGSDRSRVVAEISESRTGTGGTLRLKLTDKLSALDKLGRALGLFRERPTPEGDTDLAASANDTRELAKAVMAVLATAQLDPGDTPSNSSRPKDKETIHGGHGDPADDL